MMRDAQRTAAIRQPRQNGVWQAACEGCEYRYQPPETRRAGLHQRGRVLQRRVPKSGSSALKTSPPDEMVSVRVREGCDSHHDGCIAVQLPSGIGKAPEKQNLQAACRRRDGNHHGQQGCTEGAIYDKRKYQGAAVLRPTHPGCDRRGTSVARDRYVWIEQGCTTVDSPP